MHENQVKARAKAYLEWKEKTPDQRAADAEKALQQKALKKERNDRHAEQREIAAQKPREKWRQYMEDVDYGGENSFPDEPPYNFTHRPGYAANHLRTGGGAAALCAERA